MAISELSTPLGVGELDASADQLRQQLDRYSRLLEGLSQLAVAVGHRDSPEEIAELVVDLVRSLLSVDGTTVYLWNEAAQLLIPLVQDTQVSLSRPCRSGEGAVGLAFLTAEPVVVEDYSTWPYALKPVQTSYSSITAIPLIVADRTVGGLAVGTVKQRRFASEEIDALMVFGTQVASRLEGARLFKELERTAEYHEALTANLTDVITIADAEGRTRYLSPSMERLLGFSIAERRGRRAFELVHPDDVDRLKAHFEQALHSSAPSEPIELRIRTKSGDWKVIESVVQNLLPQPAIAGVVITSRDVTERHRALSALRQSEERYRTIVDTAYEGIISLDGRGRISYVNQRTCQMLGYETDELTGKRLAQVLRGETLRSISGQVGGILRGRKRYSLTELELTARNGTSVQVLAAATCQFSPAGRLASATVMLTDVTEQQDATNQLRLLESAMNATKEGVMIYTENGDGDHIVDYVNDGLCWLTGYAKQELVGQPLRQFRSPSLPDRERSRMGAELEKRGMTRGEGVLHRKDGLPFTAEIQIEMVPSASEPRRHWIMTLRDVTERRQSETELLRARREVSAAGERLRRDIAELLHSTVQTKLVVACHRLMECEQLLATDPGAAQALLQDVRAELDRVREQEVRRASHLLHPSIINVGLLPAIRSLISSISGDMVVTLRAGDRLQALDNVADNRLPEGVRLCVYRTIEEALSNSLRHGRATSVDIDVEVDEAAMLHLTIRDDGEGFDPSVVTSGLGLTSITGRVSDFEGSCQVISALGQGTTLVVVLPCDLLPAD